MVTYKKMLGSIRRRFFKSPQTTDVVVIRHTVSGQYSAQDEEKMEFLKDNATVITTPEKPVLSEADIAAIRIQAKYRGHLVQHLCILYWQWLLCKCNR